MMFLIERSEYDDVVSMLLMFLIERSENVMMIMIDRSEYDDDDVAADRKGKVLMMILMIERSKYRRCCC